MGGPRLRQVVRFLRQDFASERTGNTLVLRYIWKPRPESGLDCLICDEFSEYGTVLYVPYSLDSDSHIWVPGWSTLVVLSFFWQTDEETALPTRWTSRVALPRNFEGRVTIFAPHYALNLTAWDKLTFDERIVVHRVTRLGQRPGHLSTYHARSKVRISNASFRAWNGSVPQKILLHSATQHSWRVSRVIINFASRCVEESNSDFWPGMA